MISFQKQNTETPAGPRRKPGERAGVSCSINRPRIGPIPLLRRCRVVRGFVAFFIFLFSIQAHAAKPVKIGDLNEYTGLPLYADGVKQGWELALEEINAGGGVLGRPVEVISRDTKGEPGEAIWIAEELVNRENVVALMGTLFDHIGLAVGEFAARNKIPFMKVAGGTDVHVWQNGNRYSFRTGLTNHLLAKALADEAAKLPAKRWATIAPNYEYGRSMAGAFKGFLSELRPDIEWVGEYWPETGKIDAGASVQALRRDKPDGIYTVLFGSDLVQFHREGMKRDLFTDVAVFSPTMGNPEEIRVLGADTPQGWITGTYPYENLDFPGSQDFLTAFRAKYNEDPGYGAFHGYLALQILISGIAKAGSTDAEAITDAMKGLKISSSPAGSFTVRAIDNQPDIGIWIGETVVEDGKAFVKNVVYKKAEDYLPRDEEILKLQKGE